MFVCIYMHAPWRLEDTFVESILSSHIYMAFEIALRLLNLHVSALIGYISYCILYWVSDKMSVHTSGSTLTRGPQIANPGLYLI